MQHESKLFPVGSQHSEWENGYMIGRRSLLSLGASGKSSYGALCQLYWDIITAVGESRR
jgi:hypothetical protein